MSNYKSKNHSKFTLKYHIIFVCKYRKKLLIKYGEVINRDENAAINIMNVGLNMV